jgi:hypothetical protein
MVSRATRLLLTPVELNHLTDMRMADPKPGFSYLVSEIARRHPSFAYIHVVEPRAMGDEDREVGEKEVHTLYAFSLLRLGSR